MTSNETAKVEMTDEEKIAEFDRRAAASQRREVAQMRSQR